MIKYTCVKIKDKNIEKFQNQIKFEPPKELNVVVDTSDDTINKLFPKVCPRSYHKIGNICCPVFLENGKCPPPNSKDKTKYNGMPYCALNYVAATEWKEKNNSNKVLNLCSDLPKFVPPVKRKTSDLVCGRNKELIDNKCYNNCPKGTVKRGTKCLSSKINREESIPICPKNTELINGKCLSNCTFGFKPFDDYCVPDNLVNF